MSQTEECLDAIRRTGERMREMLDREGIEAWRTMLDQVEQWLRDYPTETPRRTAAVALAALSSCALSAAKIAADSNTAEAYWAGLDQIVTSLVVIAGELAKEPTR